MGKWHLVFERVCVRTGDHIRKTLIISEVNYPAAYNRAIFVLNLFFTKANKRYEYRFLELA